MKKGRKRKDCRRERRERWGGKIRDEIQQEDGKMGEEKMKMTWKRKMGRERDKSKIKMEKERIKLTWEGKKGRKKRSK